MPSARCRGRPDRFSRQHLTKLLTPVLLTPGTLLYSPDSEGGAVTPQRHDCAVNARRVGLQQRADLDATPLPTRAMPKSRHPIKLRRVRGTIAMLAKAQRQVLGLDPPRRLDYFCSSATRPQPLWCYSDIDYIVFNQLRRPESWRATPPPKWGRKPVLLDPANPRGGHTDSTVRFHPSCRNPRLDIDATAGSCASRSPALAHDGSVLAAPSSHLITRRRAPWAASPLGDGPKSVINLAEGVHPPDRGLRPRLQAVAPAPPGDPV